MSYLILSRNLDSKKQATDVHEFQSSLEKNYDVCNSSVAIPSKNVRPSSCLTTENRSTAAGDQKKKETNSYLRYKNGFLCEIISPSNGFATKPVIEVFSSKSINFQQMSNVCGKDGAKICLLTVAGKDRQTKEQKTVVTPHKQQLHQLSSHCRIHLQADAVGADIVTGVTTHDIITGVTSHDTVTSVTPHGALSPTSATVHAKQLSSANKELNAMAYENKPMLHFGISSLKHESPSMKQNLTNYFSGNTKLAVDVSLGKLLTGFPYCEEKKNIAANIAESDVCMVRNSIPDTNSSWEGLEAFALYEEIDPQELRVPFLYGFEITSDCFLPAKYIDNEPPQIMFSIVD